MFRTKVPIARKNERQRMRRAAWLLSGNGAPPMPCVIWDFSKGGCRIAAPHAARLPVVFVLAMGQDDAADRRSCHVVWRRGTYVGVQFIHDAEAERIADALPEVRPGLYRNNDRASFSEKPRKVAAPQAKVSWKTPKWHSELY